jgi:hypothetical protein
VKIKGTCKRCGREFYFEQAVANGGRCPWDGEPFSADYGTALEQSLDDLASLRPAFTVEAASVTGVIVDRIARLSKNMITQG